ncbi:uncharacterized protein [Procambarus clarkii]|uniref:uncharacterized protein n=1 Tax=Procambarus clarkii TaxID=6728 RepID=UPI001E676F37|nr:uncharacterized protein LOC123774298 [Procambarus clarkii]
MQGQTPRGGTRYEGGCHCGAVRFQVLAPSTFTVIDCNCSICQKKQNKHFLVPSSCFKLLQGHNALTTYSFNTHTAKHSFCATCGVQGFFIPASPPDSYGVVPHCLDDGPVRTITYKKVDGKNNVQASAHDSSDTSKTSDTSGQTDDKNSKQPSTPISTLRSMIEGRLHILSSPKTGDKAHKRASQKNSFTDKHDASSHASSSSASPASTRSGSSSIPDTPKRLPQNVAPSTRTRAETTQNSSVIVIGNKKEGESSQASTAITVVGKTQGVTTPHRNFIVTKVDDKNYVQFLHMNSIPRQDNEVSLL